MPSPYGRLGGSQEPSRRRRCGQSDTGFSPHPRVECTFIRRTKTGSREHRISAKCAAIVGRSPTAPRLRINPSLFTNVSGRANRVVLGRLVRQARIQVPRCQPLTRKPPKKTNPPRLKRSKKTPPDGGPTLYFQNPKGHPPSAPIPEIRLFTNTGGYLALHDWTRMAEAWARNLPALTLPHSRPPKTGNSSLSHR